MSGEKPKLPGGSRARRTDPGGTGGEPGSDDWKEQQLAARLSDALGDSPQIWISWWPMSCGSGPRWTPRLSARDPACRRAPG